MLSLNSRNVCAWIFHFLSLDLDDSRFICHSLCLSLLLSLYLSASTCPSPHVFRKKRMRLNVRGEGEKKGKWQGSVDDRSETRKERAADEEKGAGETIQGTRQTKGKRVSWIKGKQVQMIWGDVRGAESGKEHLIQWIPIAFLIKCHQIWA